MPLRGGSLRVATGSNQPHPCGVVRRFGEACAASSYPAGRCRTIRAQASRTPRSKPEVRARCLAFCLLHRSSLWPVPLDPLWAHPLRLWWDIAFASPVPAEFRIHWGRTRPLALLQVASVPHPQSVSRACAVFPAAGFAAAVTSGPALQWLEDRQKPQVMPFPEWSYQGLPSIKNVRSFPTTARRGAVS